MKHIVTRAGFEADIDENCIQDMELFDSIAAVERGDLMELPAVVQKILGDNKKALYDCVRDDQGRVPPEDVLNTVTEIILELGGKNS